MENARGARDAEMLRGHQPQLPLSRAAGKSKPSRRRPAGSRLVPGLVCIVALVYLLNASFHASLLRDSFERPAVTAERHAADEERHAAYADPHGLEEPHTHAADEDRRADAARMTAAETERLVHEAVEALDAALEEQEQARAKKWRRAAVPGHLGSRARASLLPFHLCALSVSGARPAARAPR